ncbi:3-hydroxybenzoate 6-monooxygenase [soil metagenome]
MTVAPVIIIGGGIAGLSAALSLSRVGRPSLLVEQAAEFKEVGAGIQLGPNGYRALATMGLADKADALAVFPDDLILMDAVKGDEVTRIPLGEGFVDRFKFPYALIHRADLHAVLLRACRADPNITLQTSTRITGFEQDPSGVSATTTTREVLRGSALIGADGLWSKTREAIVGDGAPEVSGHIAYRAVLPTSQVPEAFRRNAMILWGGPKCHLVQYPLRGGELYNLVAVFHSDRYVEGWDTAGDPEELQRRFAGTCDTVQTLLSRIENWRMWVLCDRAPVKDWSQGRATLIGDAAHPMLQYLAQGACMAMEDSVLLADEVSKAAGDDAAAFRNYQAQRYLRTGRCQIMARVHGEFYHAEGVAAELRNGMLSARSPEQSYDGLAWLYDVAA